METGGGNTRRTRQNSNRFIYLLIYFLMKKSVKSEMKFNIMPEILSTELNLDWTCNIALNWTSL